MKAKKRIIIVFCIVLAAFILGATGMIKMTGEEVQDSSVSDRLIGVLITREYLDLFDSDRFIDDNIDRLVDGTELTKSETAKYEGRLYASLVDTVHTNEETGEPLTSKEYVFDGIDGIRLFAPYIQDESGSYHSACIDEGITDGVTHFQSTDAGESVSLKGTVYVAAHSHSGHFYFNPVYQTSNGEVYAVSGEGVFFGEESAPGESWSTKIAENQEVTAGDTSTSTGTEVEVTVCVIEEPSRIALLQFNGKNELLTETEYSPGTFPEHIDALSDTQYMIVETASSDGLTRTLFEKDDDFADAFYCRSDGICIKQQSEIGWK